MKKGIFFIALLIVFLAGCSIKNEPTIHFSVQANTVDISISNMDYKQMQDYKLELYLGNDLIEEFVVEKEIEIFDLYYDTNYQLYLYPKDGDISDGVTASFTTELAPTPVFDITQTYSTHDEITFDITVQGPNSLLEIVNYQLFKGSDMIQEITNEQRKFSSLEPNTNYIIKVNYTVDMQDRKDPVMLSTITEAGTKDERIDRFIDTAFNASVGNKTRRYETDITYFIHNTTNQVYIDEVYRVINEIENLIGSGINFVEMNSSDNANMIIHFGGFTSFDNVVPPSYSLPNLTNEKGFMIYRFDQTGEIQQSYILIGTEYTSDETEIKSIIREEITKSLGLANEINYDTTSIFDVYNDEAFYTEYSDLDKAVIYFLYHQNMRINLSEEEVILVLNSIINNESDNSIVNP